MGEDLSPLEKVLRHLHVAESADRDILNGRPALDALEESAASLSAAIDILEELAAALEAPEEPDWEYDFVSKPVWKKYGANGQNGGLTLKQALRYITYPGDDTPDPSYRIIRRRKAGPWEKI